jgi:hypothetical protein
VTRAPRRTPGPVQVKTLSLGELIQQLVAVQRVVGCGAQVQLGERGCELAMCVDTVTFPDIEDDAQVLTLVRIRGG